MQITAYMPGKSGVHRFQPKLWQPAVASQTGPKNYHGLIKYTMFWHEAPGMVVAEHFGTEIGSRTKKSFGTTV